MFKYYHGALPPNVRHSFLRVCDKYHHSTRAATSSCLSLPKPRTELLKTREPLSKGDSRTGLIAFHIQLPKM